MEDVSFQDLRLYPQPLRRAEAGRRKQAEVGFVLCPVRDFQEAGKVLIFDYPIPFCALFLFDLVDQVKSRGDDGKAQGLFCPGIGGGDTRTDFLDYRRGQSRFIGSGHHLIDVFFLYLLQTLPPDPGLHMLLIGSRHHLAVGGGAGEFHIGGEPQSKKTIKVLIKASPFGLFIQGVAAEGEVFPSLPDT